MADRSTLPNRRNNLMLFREASKFRAYDEFPVLRPEVDPQLLVSRNDHVQPFFLTMEKDCVLVSAAGEATLVLKRDDVKRHDLVAGDFVYLPGGTPHRLIPNGTSLTLRYKARDAGLEAVSWYCDSCDTQLDEFVWDTADLLAQEGYEKGALRFNADQDRRLCKSCGVVAAPIDMGPYRWAEIARSIRDEQQSVSEETT